MENASKALLMAASVLIGILILSLAVYLFVTFGASSAELHKQTEENQLNQFNSQFTVYNGTKVNIYDIITIANIATDNNIYYELGKKSTETDGKDYYISVKVPNDIIEGLSYGTSYIEKGYDYKEKIDYNEIISNSLGKMITPDGMEASTLPTYKCTVNISETTHRVYKVTFE